MTAQQLRAFRALVRTWKDLEASGNGRMAMVWSNARRDVDRAFGIEHAPVGEEWFAINHRIIAATHRLAGAR